MGTVLPRACRALCVALRAALGLGLRGMGSAFKTQTTCLNG